MSCDFCHEKDTDFTSCQTCFSDVCYDCRSRCSKCMETICPSCDVNEENDGMCDSCLSNQNQTSEEEEESDYEEEEENTIKE
jgi:hypothetical protein